METKPSTMLAAIVAVEPHANRRVAMFPSGNLCGAHNDIGNSGRFHAGSDVMCSYNMCALDDQRRLRSKRSEKSLIDRRVLSALRQRAPDEGLPRRSYHDWESRFLQLAEASQQWVVFLEAFSKPKSRVDHQLVSLDSCQHSFLCPLSQFPFHQQD